MWPRKVEIPNINELGEPVSSTLVFLNMHCQKFLNPENCLFRKPKRVNCSRKCLLLGVTTHGCAYQKTPLHWHQTWKNKSTFVTFTLTSFQLHAIIQAVLPFSCSTKFFSMLYMAAFHLLNNFSPVPDKVRAINVPIFCDAKDRLARCPELCTV
jgi:hypothetical protein